MTAYNNPPGNYPPDPRYNPAVDKVVTTSDMGDARVDNYRETYVDAYGNAVHREEETFDDPYQRRLNILDRASAIIYTLVAALEILLTLRLFFRLFGADPTSGFVSFIYNLSNPFVIFFNGIFSDQTLNNTSVFEISTLLAMVMYALLAWGLVSILYALFSPNPSSRHNITTTRRSKY
jgi:hypothetical protein